MKLPNEIKKLLTGQEYSLDRVGMSGSTILLFRDKVLKIQKYSREAEQEYQMLKWLWGKVPVPRVFAFEKTGEDCFLLMDRCLGEMSCSEENRKTPDKTVRLLADALRTLWAVDTGDCPVDSRLGDKLAMARYNVENGLVDMDNVEPETFGAKGFQSPQALLAWLYENQPSEEPVLSHGDFCLPNIFLDGEKVSGYIDWGRGGIADKWQDIALCYRSLCHNAEGRYGDGLAGYKADKLFDYLGLEPDREKLRYYILLDELF